MSKLRPSSSLRSKSDKGIMEKRMEATVWGYISSNYIGFYRGYIGMMEKKMEATV